MADVDDTGLNTVVAFWYNDSLFVGWYSVLGMKLKLTREVCSIKGGINSSRPLSLQIT